MKQEIVFGKDSFSKLKNYIALHNGNSILLVTGKSSFEKCGAKGDLDIVLSDFKVTRFFDFEENPKIDDVSKGVKLFHDNACDIIIAVGGGSSIDMAKLINFFKKKPQPYSNHLISDFNDKDSTPLVAIPTTAGAGSEATHFAVVYFNNIKYSIANQNLRPNLVLLNSNYLRTQPTKQLIVSGLDAFCQGIESYWCVNSTELSTKYSKLAIIKIWNNLEKASRGEEVWNELTEGAYYAGKAIDITKTTGPHALSYGFTINYGIPHGHAVGLFLPFFIDFHIKITESTSNDSRGSLFVKNRMQEIAKILNVDIDNLVTVVVEFLEKLGIEINFEKLAINKENYFKALKGMNADRLRNNPRVLRKENLSLIYEFNSNF